MAGAQCRGGALSLCFHQRSAHSVPTQQFVTADQLQQALAPISFALHELMARFTSLLTSQPTSARLNPVFSSPFPLNGQ